MNPKGLAILTLALLLVTGTSGLASSRGAVAQSGANEASVMAGVSAPGIPAKFQISYATNTSVLLHWQPPDSNGGSPITNYTIYRGSALGKESALAVIGNNNTYLDSTVRSGTSYFYQVTASNSVGESHRANEVAARVGSTYVITLDATFLETGLYLDSYPAGSSRSSLASVGGHVWSGNVNSSTTLNLSALPQGTYAKPPNSPPWTGRGTFSFVLDLATSCLYATGPCNPGVATIGNFTLTLSAQGQNADNESLPLFLNVRDFEVIPSPATVYLGQNETVLGTLCPSPSPGLWSSVSLSIIYQRPDGSQTARLTSVNVSTTDMCTNPFVMDKFGPNETGIWYVHATATLQGWDGTTETMRTPPNIQQGFPSGFSTGFSVSVAPPRSLSVALSAKPLTVFSAGASVITATVSASDGGNPQVAYRWGATGGTLNSTTGNPVSWTAPVVQSSTSFVVSLTATASGYIDGSSAILLPVLPPPLLNVTITESALSGYAPLTVQFSANATGGYPPYTFSWNFGDGATSSAQNPSHLFASPGNYTTALTVVDSRQFNSTKKVLVTASQRPPLSATIGVTPTSGVAPLNVQFSAIVSGGTPPYSYAWNFGDGGSSTVPAPIHTYSAAGTYPVTLTVTDAAGKLAGATAQISAVAPTFAVTFTESGLPSGTTWSITFNGRPYSSGSNTISISGQLAGSYQWNASEVDPCQGCRFTPSQLTGSLVVPVALSQSLSFRGEYLVSLVSTPSGIGTISPVGNSWYAAGSVLSLSAKPNSTYIWNGWVATGTITLGNSSVTGGTAKGTAIIIGPGTVTARFVDAWSGSYLKTYYGSMPWHPEIIEIHLAAIDSTQSFATSQLTAVGTFLQGQPTVTGSVGLAGTFFSFIGAPSGIAGSANPDGSYDYTVVQVAGNVGYLFAGLLSTNTMATSPVGGIPLWVGPLSLPAPHVDKLVFGNSILPFATVVTLSSSPAGTGSAQNVVSLFDPQGRLYLSVQDAQGRTTGMDSRSNSTTSAIPGSYYAEIGRVMAVVLPSNVTSFSYMVDGTRASQSIENYTLALEASGSSGFSAQKILLAGVGKGTSATYGVVLASGTITNVRLYAVSLDAVDGLGLPASGAAATLTSAGGEDATIAPGKTAMLPAGQYTLRMDYLGQSVRQTVDIGESGPIAVRIALSEYGVVLIVAIAAALAGGVFFLWKRRGASRAAAKVSEWLR